jgi:hypothetical protein
MTTKQALFLSTISLVAVTIALLGILHVTTLTANVKCQLDATTKIRVTQDSIIAILNSDLEAQAANVKRLTSGFHVREMELLQEISDQKKTLQDYRSGVHPMPPGVLQGPPWRKRGGWVQPPLKEEDSGRHNQTEART